MKAIWNTLGVYSVFFGGAMTLFALMSSSLANGVIVAGFTVGLVVVFNLMVWRHDVYARDQKRHGETLRLLYGIYKAAVHEN